ncbi:visual pigment-like receptor peropsin [Ptychodera flava]|uniref:visual pigment-like receptor peropsin n=1 Tax=Ptychodera flava TaxID=63121 RepID=UPI003969CDB4
MEKQLDNLTYYATGVTIALIGILGAFGNIMVQLAFIIDKKIRTPTNIFILSISLSDLAISVFGNPISASASLSRRWLFGEAGCKWYGFANTFFGLVSINTHALIAIDRYLIIVKPHIGCYITKKRAVMMSTVAWFLALLWSVFPLIGWSEYTFEGAGMMCSVLWQSDETDDVLYVVSLFLSSFVLPITIMIFCYVGVFRTLRSAASIQAAWNPESAEKNLKVQKSFFKMVFIIAMAYLISWTPYSVVALMSTFGDPKYISATSATIPAILAKTSIIYNPIIYVVMNRNFRRAFLKMMTCCFHGNVDKMKHPVQEDNQMKDKKLTTEIPLTTYPLGTTRLDSNVRECGCPPVEVLSIPGQIVSSFIEKSAV